MKLSNSLVSGDPLRDSEFLRVLVKKLRSFDSYGTWKNISDEAVLRPYIKTKEDKKKIDTSGSVDAKTLWLIRVYFEAVAQRVEERIEGLIYSAQDIGTEGFGRAFVICDDYILYCQTLRNAHRFSFKSLEDLALSGEEAVQKAVLKADEMGLSLR